MDKSSGRIFFFFFMFRGRQIILVNVSIPKRNKFHLFQGIFYNFICICGVMRLFIRDVDAFVLTDARD